jgi:hypothetical protein
VCGADPTGYFSIAGSGVAIIQSAKAYIVELSLIYVDCWAKATKHSSHYYCGGCEVSGEVKPVLYENST